MNLLAVETSTENCSVAILNEDRVFSRSEVSPQKHAEILIPMIDALLKEASLKKDDLDGLILGAGPGSFTGVRIAASAVQGLALALDLKVAKITSLMTMAMEALSHKSASYVVSSIDARMGEVYVAVYKVEGSALEIIGEEKVLKPDAAIAFIKESIGDCTDVITAGSGIEILEKNGFTHFEKLSSFPEAKFMLNLGAEMFSLSKVCDPSEALPLYVRNEVTWKKVSEQ